MNIYHLSEDELNQLESCSRQLDLVVDLCSQIPEANRKTVTVDGVMHFVSAMNDTIARIQSAALERYEAERAMEQQGIALSPALLMFALRIAHGRRSNVPAGAKKGVSDALDALSKVDDEWQQVAHEWALVTEQQSPNQDGEASAPTARNREHLTAGA